MSEYSEKVFNSYTYATYNVSACLLVRPHSMDLTLSLSLCLGVLSGGIINRKAFTPSL